MVKKFQGNIIYEDHVYNENNFIMTQYIYNTLSTLLSLFIKKKMMHINNK